LSIGKLFLSFKKDPRRIIFFRNRNEMEEVEGENGEERVDGEEGKGGRKEEREGSWDIDYLEPVLDLSGLLEFLSEFAEEQKTFMASRFYIIGKKSEEPAQEGIFFSPPSLLPPLPTSTIIPPHSPLLFPPSLTPSHHPHPPKRRYSSAPKNRSSFSARAFG
jgi:hypothetical protein